MLQALVDQVPGLGQGSEEGSPSWDPFQGPIAIHTTDTTYTTDTMDTIDTTDTPDTIDTTDTTDTTNVLAAELKENRDRGLPLELGPDQGSDGPETKT